MGSRFPPYLKNPGSRERSRRVRKSAWWTSGFPGSKGGATLDADGEEGGGLGVEDFGFPRIEREATLDADEDAMAEAANTSLEIEGFETGAGFGLEGRPDEGSRDVEIEMMEIRSSAFGEVDFKQAEPASSAELGGEGPGVDQDLGRADEGDLGIPDTVDLTTRGPVDLTIPDDVELTIPEKRMAVC